VLRRPKHPPGARRPTLSLPRKPDQFGDRYDYLGAPGRLVGRKDGRAMPTDEHLPMVPMSARVPGKTGP
jgi:hypothetical protein